MTEHKITDAEHERLLARYGTSRSGHAVFSPSGSGAWLNCSRSLLANLNYPDRGSFEAAEGTVAHAIAERTLESHLEARKRTAFKRPFYKPEQEISVIYDQHEEDGTVHRITVDQSMVDYVRSYVDWCLSVVADDHFFVGVECRVDLSWLFPIDRQGGTADFVCIRRDFSCVIADLKYGKGVAVSAVGNTQFMLYALGILREWEGIVDIREFELRCCQPRLGTFESWVVSVADLRLFEKRVIEKARSGWREVALATPSPKACRWCKHKINCNAIMEQANALADASFDDDDCEDVAGDQLASDRWAALDGGLSFETAPMGQISDRYLVRVLEWQSWLESYFNSCRQELDARSKLRKIEGTKIVPGKSSREWVNEHQIVDHLSIVFTEDEIAPRVLLSVAKVEDLLKKQKIGKKLRDRLLGAEQVRRVPGKPTLVVETDRRPSMEDVTASAFSDHDDDV